MAQDTTKFTYPSQDPRPEDFGHVRAEAAKQSEQNVILDGKFHSLLEEPFPMYDDAKSEKIIGKGLNNSWIILGRDRPGTKETGYGSLPNMYRAGAIDLVVGIGGTNPISADKDGSQIYVDKNFKWDSARVYISQKSNIDEYFGIVHDSPNSTAKSGVGIKADGVRIVARESVKIVTGIDSRNSNGEFIKGDGTRTISLIGDNGTILQHMLLGDNVKDLLIEVLEQISKLNGHVRDLTKRQAELDMQFCQHTHLTPLNGMATFFPTELYTKGVADSIKLLSNISTDLIAQVGKLKVIKSTYLQRGKDPLSKPITSDYCYLN